MRRAILLGLVLAAVAVRADDTVTPAKFEPSADERDVLKETNRERKAAELKELRLNEALTKAARWYAATMAVEGELGHEVGGKGFAERFKASGYKFGKGGENVASGQKTPADAVEAWRNSPHHKENLLNPAFTDIGVGTATAEDGTPYWVQIFGAPRAE